MTALVAATTANVLDKTEKMLVSLAACRDRVDLLVTPACERRLLAGTARHLLTASAAYSLHKGDRVLHAQQVWPKHACLARVPRR